MEHTNILLLLSCLWCVNGLANINIPWSSFLERHDPWWEWQREKDGTWTTLPVSWEQGSFFGNGLLGGLIFVNNQTHELQWVVGRTDVWDHRQPGQPYSLNDFSFDKPRLPVGTLHMTTLGSPLSGLMFLHLYNATIDGVLATTSGTVKWTSFTPAEDDVIVIDVEVEGGESVGFWWEAAPATSPRNASKLNPKYVANPPAVPSQSSGCNVSSQPLLAGGGHVTAWKQIPFTATHSTVFLSVGYDQQTLTAAESFAVTQVALAQKLGVDALLVNHTLWWNAFYQKSFISVMDTKMEGFYYLQMYKLASGTRGDTPPLDLLGPWMPVQTPWPDLHWDLNVQATYWPLYASNHLDIAESLPKLIYSGIDNMARNVPKDFEDSIALPMASSPDLLTSCYDNHTASCLIVPEEELGNLMWVCHDLWLHYRYGMDKEYLEGVFYPILRKAVNFYLNLAYFNLQDSYYHIPISWSPEYPVKGPDSNYDVSLFRWGLITLMKVVNLLGISDPLLPTWIKYNATLTPYPSNEATGYFIAQNVPLTVSQHLYSHLFMIYPLHIVSYQPNSTSSDIIVRSLDHWCSLNSTFRGHSFTGSASLSALVGRPEAALGNLTYFLNGGCSGGLCGIGPNTLYYEENEQWACIETPGTLTVTLHELFLQSWDEGLIQVFPSMSTKWPNAVFYNLLTEGAFLVTAKWLNSSTQFVQVL